jgi:hypothetical protein
LTDALLRRCYFEPGTAVSLFEIEARPADGVASLLL